MLHYLRDVFPHNKSVHRTIEDIAVLLNTLELFIRSNLSDCHIIFDPLLHSETVFRGILVRAYVDSGTPSTLQGSNVPRWSCIAVGGQYSHLVPSKSAFGISIAVETLTNIISFSEKSISRSTSPTVFIASTGEEGFSEHLKIAGELWEHGIHAAFSSNNQKHLIDQQNEAIDLGAVWLLTVKEKVLQTLGSVKLKHLEKKTEMDIPRAEVVKFFSHTSKKIVSR